MKIKDLVVGQKAALPLVLAGADIRKTKGNPPRDFLSLSLSDGTDQIDGKIWNYNAALGVPEVGKVYIAAGQIGEYQGKKQITLDSLPLSDDQDMAPFMPCYVEDPERFYDAALSLIEQIEDVDLRDFMRILYTEHRTEIINSSSAKGIHHCGRGGNIVHCLQVAGIACQIREYLVRVCHYEPINRDLCIAGGLLHDIGKLLTYKVDGAVIEYTRLGKEEDHIILGIRLFDEALYGTSWGNRKWANALRHIIASHHGELEYGAAVNPLFIEAYIVNWADGISATTDTVFAANKKALDEGKEYTDKIWTCHNREHILQKDVM